VTERLPQPPGILFVLALGVVGTLRLLDVAAAGGPTQPVATTFLLAAAGAYAASLAALARGFGWGWYGTIVFKMLWTLEAAARYDVLAVVVYFYAVTYLYDTAERYVDLEDYGLFRASV
jgi:hypothetical protein